MKDLPVYSSKYDYVRLEKTRNNTTPIYNCGLKKRAAIIILKALQSRKLSLYVNGCKSL